MADRTEGRRGLIEHLELLQICATAGAAALYIPSPLTNGVILCYSLNMIPKHLCRVALAAGIPLASSNLKKRLSS
jgi:hypothetical protein